jgi:uncharacterized iron-regulated membrane protein
MKLKKIIGKIHLWIGLISGTVVLVSMLAAAVFVWDQELTDWWYRDLVFVEKADSTKSLSTLLLTAQQAMPDRVIEGVDISNDAARAYEFSTYKRNKNPRGITHWDDYVYWDNIYINQYTGHITGTVNMLTNWVDLTRRLHQNLLLRYNIGHYIVGFCTLFVFLLIVTGLVLWLPKTKAALKQRFTINWRARWRRINYDTHNVGGFYSWSFIAIFAITGLVWTFDWWTDAIYRILGNDPENIWEQHQPLPVSGMATMEAVDLALADVVKKRPTWTRLYMSLPSPTDEASEISVFIRFEAGSGWDESDEYVYNPKTGALWASKLQENKTLGAKWRNSNYAIHVGSIFGLPTKIIASLTALFLASLPVTGFMIWWGRRNKKDKQRNIHETSMLVSQRPAKRRHPKRVLHESLPS